MHPLLIVAIVVATLCAIVALLWFLAGRRKRCEDELERKSEERGRLRRLMHRIRRHATPEDVQDVRQTCSTFRLQYEDVGTTYDELDEFFREAHLLAAEKFFADMGKGLQDPLLCMTKIIEHLHHAQRPYDWGAIDTTRTSLCELYHVSLIARARKLHEQMKRGDVYVMDPLKQGEIEALLILADATEDDLYPPSESDTTKKA
ncbi:MAG: hypothetical protein WC866_05800 [Patescibacteria group bacterium]|jgi:hypothetical protein